MTLFVDLVTESKHEGDLLYHYTSREGLRAILESGNLRLNSLDRMNDPRERTEWVADSIVLPPGGVGIASLAKQHEVIDQVDVLLRLAARLACLTDDRPLDPSGDPAAFFHRGWGRARMWEQYGRQHTGAVLVFDKTELIAALDESRAVGDGDVFSPSPVRYEDRRLSIPMSGYYETVESIKEAIDDLTSKGGSIADLFFVKNRDWAGETEFRILVVFGEQAAVANFGQPLDLSYRDSLRGVVVGERWDGADWLRPAATVREIEGSIVRCVWDNGSPGLARYGT